MIRRLSLLLTGVALLLGGGVLVTAGVAGADPGNGNGAFIARDFGCGLTDGNGAFVFTTTSHSIINVNNSVTKCSATVAPSSTGGAVITSGFPCGVELRNGTFVATTDSRETVSASGQATLTCKASDS
jgi:hypothetical protein